MTLSLKQSAKWDQTGNTGTYRGGLSGKAFTEALKNLNRSGLHQGGLTLGAVYLRGDPPKAEREP
jgi:hypothetical protein